MNNQGRDILSLKRNHDFIDLKIAKNSTNRLKHLTLSLKLKLCPTKAVKIQTLVTATKLSKT